MKRLLIVADHSFVVEAIRLALRQTSGFKVIGFVDGRHSVLEPMRGLHPDVVLVDEMQESSDGLARVREIVAEVPSAKVLMLTLSMNPAWHREVFAAGAHAVISKTVHPVSLGTLVREIANGTVVHRFDPGPEPVSEVAEECPLTARELEIARLAAEGLTNSVISRKLWVTEQTVKFHLSNTYRKLGVANRTEAALYIHRLDQAARRPIQLAS